MAFCKLKNVSKNRNKAYSLCAATHGKSRFFYFPQKPKFNLLFLNFKCGCSRPHAIIFPPKWIIVWKWMAFIGQYIFKHEKRCNFQVLRKPFKLTKLSNSLYGGQNKNVDQCATHKAFGQLFYVFALKCNVIAVFWRRNIWIDRFRKK